MTVHLASKEDDESELAFGPFRLIRSQRQLYCSDKPVRLGEPSYKVLEALVDRPGETIDNLALIQAVWGSLNVEESNLRAAVAALRRAMTDAGCERPYVTTVPRRGYRFCEPVSLQASATVRRLVPAPRVHVVGREVSVAELVEDLRASRLISVVGAGGVGKTTVAQCVAREALERGCVDDVAFVSLDTVETADGLVNAFLRDLGVSASGDDAWADLESFLDNRRTLIIVDNCDRLIESVAPVVEDILSIGPNVRVLCTSREPLRAADERRRRLEGLPVPSEAEGLTAARALKFAAVELFVERATASNPSFQLTDSSAPYVASICRLLDGCPLAIVAAAARMDAFDLPVLAQLIEGPFRLQMQGRATASPRHRSLAAALDWSFEALAPEEKIVLRRLAVFSGTFTFEAARQIAGFGDVKAVEVSDIVGRLVSKSLVASSPDGAQGRRRLEHTVRIYAGEKLDQSGERAELARRHATYYGAVLTAARSRTDLRNQSDWDRAYRADFDQFRAALEWAGSLAGDDEIYMTLTLGALPLWDRLGLKGERPVLPVAAEAAPAGQPTSRERLLQIAATKLREGGMDGFAIQDLMAEAGLRPAAFHSYFSSRDELIVEALRSVCGWLGGRIEEERAKGDRMTVARTAGEYLTTYNRDNPGMGCATSALLSDLSRGSKPVRALYTERVHNEIRLLSGMLGGETDPSLRAKAFLVYAAMVGAIGISRAVDSIAFSDEILQSVESELAKL
jgi:predicted ATPase/DNA-binding winged helix-turn-helix (wHTH) protein/AcrR family transcriptional regulator